MRIGRVFIWLIATLAQYLAAYFLIKIPLKKHREKMMPLQAAWILAYRGRTKKMGYLVRVFR